MSGVAFLPPFIPPDSENLIQRNLRNKVCAYCKKPGARKKCEACEQRTYCDKKCQKKDWKAVHRGQCKKLQQVFVPPKAGWREIAAVAVDGGDGGGGGGGGGAAVAVGGAVGPDEDGEIENPCPICLDNEDDAVVRGKRSGMCFACGQSYCGGCNTLEKIGQVTTCPTCRAPFAVSGEEDFKRLWKLVHDRSPGRHTPNAQNNLGYMLYHGESVKQDFVDAIKWFRRSAEQGVAAAQHSLGLMYKNGQGLKQDYTEAIKWYRLAIDQGHAAAQFNLGLMHYEGQSVKQDYAEAVKLYRLAAEQGDANAQANLGGMYYQGHGVPRDDAEVLKWWQLAAEQGYEEALANLNNMQQHHLIPTPPPGTTITTVLLTSAAASKYNNKKGIVVVPSEGQPAVKVGRVAVLLEGEANPISFKLMNLRPG